MGRENDPSGGNVHTCYEAGCFGYTLHRGQWEAGNTRALTSVRVPTPDEEQRREAGRHRQRLLKERTRLEKRAASLMLLSGIKAGKGWWRPPRWATLQPQLSGGLAATTATWRAGILSYETLQNTARKQLEARSHQHMESLPAGIGSLTWELLGAEILTWNRFKNRRQVASYTGLCPGESSSGESRRQGSIIKHGNPRVRALLIEAVWRLSRFERGWQGFHKSPLLLRNEKSGGPKRKQAVAAARRLAIDLWRLATGQTEVAKLGFSQAFRLKPAPVPAPENETTAPPLPDKSAPAAPAGKVKAAGPEQPA